MAIGKETPLAQGRPGMNQKIGRNELCPCGSGKKYKKCCLREGVAETRSRPSNLPAGRFRFEAGAYGEPDKGYVSAVLSLKQVEDDWQPHFLLANARSGFESLEPAVDFATMHLDTAFAQKVATGSDEEAAKTLQILGYQSVEGFRIENFYTGELDSVESGRVQESFLQVVEEQLLIGEPKETGLTLQRLIAMGYEEDEAKGLIAHAVEAEILTVMSPGQEYDQDRYVQTLRRLPELPENQL